MLDFHLHQLFGKCAVMQVNVSVGEVRLCLKLVRSIQQLGAQVSGVFEVLRMQLEVVTQWI